MNYAVIDAGNIVVNLIRWDGVAPYAPGAGLTLVQSDAAAIGDVYIDGTFTKPEAQEE